MLSIVSHSSLWLCWNTQLGWKPSRLSLFPCHGCLSPPWKKHRSLTFQQHPWSNGPTFWIILSNTVSPLKQHWKELMFPMDVSGFLCHMMPWFQQPSGRFRLGLGLSPGHRWEELPWIPMNRQSVMASKKHSWDIKFRPDPNHPTHHQPIVCHIPRNMEKLCDVWSYQLKIRCLGAPMFMSDCHISYCPVQMAIHLGGHTTRLGQIHRILLLSFISYIISFCIPVPLKHVSFHKQQNNHNNYHLIHPYTSNWLFNCVIYITLYPIAPSNKIQKTYGFHTVLRTFHP